MAPAVPDEAAALTAVSKKRFLCSENGDGYFAECACVESAS